ncbi:ThiF family adenylyltransferase [Gryllotalpicola protaetiae]|uniref:Molybdopterin biosynthesis protein MoeB n=1 Tax=Gryllotalpicola protaetiae TaxID=2419771 RepID=A0A387BSE9_9MICO|nr:ThiF family adenylyltransferase [Gryllotalpicola protaetiae]AYG03980.1 molybdopterin biosynthesis protein MoeB [Gryllotalpicola protaetiae]
MADLARYSRQLMLPGFGAGGQAALGSARVLVIGAGGLGSAVLPQLAAMGVGTIGIVDDDVVDTTNLHRQTLYAPYDVGAPKAARAAARLRELNPEVTVRAHLDRLSSANALELFGAYDLVVDGSDNFPTRYLVDDAATLAGIPSVWGAVHQFGGQVGISWDAQGPTYRDLFPVPPEPGTVPSCAEAGVLPSVCAVVGGLLVSEAVKLITGIGSPLLGRVVAYDARGGGFRELSYDRDPERMPVGELIDYERFCGLAPAQEETDSADMASPDDVPDEITPAALAALREGGEAFQLVDVRQPWEAELASIDGAVLIPLRDLPARWQELDPAAPTVIYCHSGVRSAQARDLLRSIDFENATSLAGGIDAWSREVDASIPRY